MLGLIVTRIKGAAIVMVMVEIFPVDKEGKVTQENFRKTQIEERSENGTENIYQSK